jgi:hypothetical protein
MAYGINVTWDFHKNILVAFPPEQRPKKYEKNG